MPNGQVIVGGATTGAAVGWVLAGPIGAFGGALGGAAILATVEWCGGLPYRAATQMRTAPAAATTQPTATSTTQQPATPAASSSIPKKVATSVFPPSVEFPTSPSSLSKPKAQSGLPLPVAPKVPAIPTPVTTVAVLAPPLPDPSKPVPTAVPPAVVLPPTPAMANPALALIQQTPPPIGLPKPLPLKEQIKGMTLKQLILPPTGTSGGKVLFRRGTVDQPETVKPPVGVHKIQFRYQDDKGNVGDVESTELHIRPLIKDVMGNMGYTSRGGRWDLSVRAKNVGSKPYNFHLSVPKALQEIPESIDKWDVIFEGIFPSGASMDVTHMTCECRQGPDLNNAHWYLGGEGGDPQGNWNDAEKTAFKKACKVQLDEWNRGAMASLKAAWQ